MCLFQMRKCKSRAIKHVAPSAYAKCLRNFTYAKWLRHASAQAKWPTQLLKSSLLYKFHHFKKNRSSYVQYGRTSLFEAHPILPRKSGENPLRNDVSDLASLPACGHGEEVGEKHHPTIVEQHVFAAYVRESRTPQKTTYKVQYLKKREPKGTWMLWWHYLLLKKNIGCPK